MFERSRTITEQVEAMTKDWPRFKSRKSGPTEVVWRGELKPQFVVYRIEIRYTLGEFPEVRILSPKLQRLEGNKEGPLPHVYWDTGDPSLCLFDPAAGEWNGSMLISETTIPWSIDWLTFYEFWLMTGEWKGGGRHPRSLERAVEVEQ